MIPWIQIYSNLITHPKTSRLADLLSLTCKDASPNVVAAGLLVSLWTWAIQNAYNGDLSACSDRAIADAARYRRKPDVFVTALTDAGWLDKDRHLHDWEEYTAQLVTRLDNQKEKTRQRVQKHRSKKETPNVPECNAPTSNAPCNVTVTQCNAPTLPKPLPLPNQPSNFSASNSVDFADAPQDELAPLSGKPFTVFWESYPSKIDRESAWEAWKALTPSPDTVRLIMTALEAWKRSSQWTEDGGRFVPNAAKFLSKGYWKSPPLPAGKKTGSTTWAADWSTLGQAELEAIQQVLAEDPTKRQLDEDEQDAIHRLLNDTPKEG